MKKKYRKNTLILLLWNFEMVLLKISKWEIVPCVAKGWLELCEEMPFACVTEVCLGYFKILGHFVVIFSNLWKLI